MDQEIRNKLRNVVTQCRTLLEKDTRDSLEGRFRIYEKKGDVVADPNAPMTHLEDPTEIQARAEILDHFGHIKARGFKPKDALDQLVREIAFTHLNRLCAYKMMEAREVYVGGQKFREAVGRGINSNGVKFYLADHPEEERRFKTGQQDIAYRHFLDWLGGFLSDEIGVLFNPNDPANRLYPRQKTLDAVLDLLNGGGIRPDETELREAWPKIWSQDETIGWVYQYFTPKELRDAARDPTKGGSAAPRNSYELAFRNQFFTPRYVVEFLTDNTVGRIWYEMRKGDTRLKDQCRYMVRRPTEVFLKAGEQPPKGETEGRDELSQDELLKLPVHFPHRPKKDPRELKILDPACGSGHFLLYCFDLLQTIYEEAYSDPDLGPALQKEYSSLAALRREMPRLMLAHNLHGIDIDLRATQIAALALWLRCQRAYQENGLKKDRPQITRSNFVCAEPMPGEAQMLKEFVSQLEPKLLGQIVEVVFEKMKLAGEAGSLLKIEEEIRDAVAAAKKQWAKDTAQALDRKGQPLLFTQAMIDRLAGKPEQESLFDLTDISDAQFFEEAEVNVKEALRQYAEQSRDAQRLPRQLFRDDTVRGFSFVDVSQRRYDAVLMNPPFGESSSKLEEHLAEAYPHWNKNLLCAFIERAYQLSSPVGMVGVIFDRTAIVKSTYEDFRRAHLISDARLHYLADLGWGVLDANVEVTTSVISHSSSECSVFVDAREIARDDKGEWIAAQLSTLPAGHLKNVLISDTSGFATLPNAVIGYDFPKFLIKAFDHLPSLEASGLKAHQGFALKAEKHFRTWWEVPSARRGAMNRLFNGAGYSPYVTNLYDVAISDVEPEQLPMDSSTRKSGLGSHRLKGVCFGKRCEVFCAHILPEGHIFTVEGQSIPVANEDKALDLVGLLNTPLIRLSLNKYCGQHKYSGYVNLLPYSRLNDNEARDSLKRAIGAQLMVRQYDEVQSYFCAPLRGLSLSAAADMLTSLIQESSRADQMCEDTYHVLTLKAYKVSPTEYAIVEAFREAQPKRELPIEDADYGQGCHRFVTRSWLSYSVGCVFGRWDIRFATGAAKQPELPDPFIKLPLITPGMLQSGGKMPSSASVSERYPLDVGRDGVLVDDPGHPDDIVKKVSGVLDLIWKGRGETIESEARAVLSVMGLRDYFRKPGKGGFWDDHITRYSKSRRKAPIYWLLQSSKKNYGVWLYYHRLDKDLLFKVLVNYVEPKIRLETSRLETFRSQKAATGDSGKEGKRLAKEIEWQEDFLSELRDFEDKLRRAANLQLEPDLNDGVVLNIAPLCELVPWKEAKNYWDELLEGKYEWSSIGKQLRQKRLVK